MSKEKLERHDAGHDPAHRTDSAHDGDHDASHAASEHQRQAPTDGVRGHSRWGDGEELFDIKGRVIGFSVVGDATELLVGAGRQQGVHVGMDGFILAGDTFLTELQVVETTKRSCRVRVQGTPDQLREHLDGLVINPSSRPAKASEEARDFKTRVIKVAVVGGKTEITLSGGKAQGIRYDCGGVLLDEHGKRLAGFTIEHVHARTATATVDTNVDTVYRAASAVVNPS